MPPVVEMQQYRFRLLGIIDHLGCSANSGHYTSTLFRNDSSFHCNDQVITESAGVTGGYSSTVNMVFYVLSSLDVLLLVSSLLLYSWTWLVCDVAGHRGW